jgi:DNA-binding HxlR family transcriptional regulator
VVGRSQRRSRLVVQLNFPAYPIQASLGVLGRKWALLILMNIALSRAQRFNEMLRSVPGMSKRILALRLSQLERDGYISRAEQRRGLTRWQLTQKGGDVLPVLLTLIHFGSKWNPRGDATGSTSATLESRFDVMFHRGPARRAPGGSVPMGDGRKSPDPSREARVR